MIVPSDSSEGWSPYVIRTLETQRRIKPGSDRDETVWTMPAASYPVISELPHQGIPDSHALQCRAERRGIL